MATDFAQLSQDLQSSDSEILSLSLGTIGRTRFSDLRLDRATVLGLYEQVLAHCEHKDSDLGFLARKAREHMHAQLPWLKAKHEKESEFQPVHLHSEDVETRFNAINSLMAKPNADTQRILIWHFLRERNPKILANMVLALAQCENPKVVSLLQSFLYSKDDRLRANAVEAIDSLGDRNQILSMLPVMLNDENNRVRANALKAVGRFAPQDVLSHLETMVSSPEVSRRASALYVLKNMQGNGVSRLLSIAASDPFTENRLKVIELLLELPDKEAEVVLKRLSQDEDIDVSEAALQALRDRETLAPERSTGFDIHSIRSQKSQDHEKPQPNTPVISMKDLQHQAEELDQKIDAEMLLLGQAMRKGIKSGLYKNVRMDELLGFSLTIDRLEQQLQAKLAGQKPGVQQRILRQFGFLLRSDLEIMEARGRLEDALMDLGYETMRVCKDTNALFVGVMDRVKKIEALFLTRRQLELDINRMQEADK